MRAKRGFTLTELLVVVCVILILMSILVVGAGGVFTYANRLKCQHRMEQIWHACQMYANNNGILPRVYDSATSNLWYDTLFDAGYLDNADAIQCPSSEIVAAPGTGGESPGSGSEEEAYETVAKILNYLNNPAHQAAGSGGGIRWTEDGGGSPATVAFGVMAYIGAGYGIDHATYGTTIRNALKHRIYYAFNDPDGLMDRGSAFQETYQQGIVTIALSDAYRLMGDVDVNGVPGQSLREAAQRVVDGLVLIQHQTYGSWPYAWPTRAVELNDNNSTCWGYQGLAAAHQAGLVDISQDPLRTLLDTYLAVANRDYKPGGRGGVPYHHPTFPNYVAMDGLSQSWLGDPIRLSPWRMTAGMLGVKLLMGYTPDDTDCQDHMYWLTNSGYAGVNGQTAGEPDFMYFTRTWSDLRRDLYIKYYVTLSLYQWGGTEWTSWIEAMVPTVIAMTQQGANPDEAYCATNTVTCGGYGGRVYPSSFAAMSLEMANASMFPGSRWYWYDAGRHSYGYNELIANPDYRSRKPANDTIILMDYVHDAIDADTDTPDDIAPRHGGKANVLFADGRVKAMTVDELVDTATDKIRAGMLTLEPGD